jgi:hypothetical protein
LHEFAAQLPFFVVACFSEKETRRHEYKTPKPASVVEAGLGFNSVCTTPLNIGFRSLSAFRWHFQDIMLHIRSGSQGIGFRVQGIG